MYNEDDARCPECSEWICEHTVDKPYPEPEEEYVHG
jgi:ribosomal protein L32